MSPASSEPRPAPAACTTPEDECLLSAGDHALSVASIWPASERVLGFLMGIERQRYPARGDVETFLYRLQQDVRRAGGAWEPRLVAMRAAAKAALIATNRGSTQQACECAKLAALWSEVAASGSSNAAAVAGPATRSPSSVR